MMTSMVYLWESGVSDKRGGDKFGGVSDVRLGCRVLTNVTISIKYI